jgi:Zn-dependent protease
MVSIAKKEVTPLLIGGVVLGFLFGYDDGQATFDVTFWLTNLLTVTIIALLALTIYHLAHKAMAKKLGCDATLNIWGMTKATLEKKSYVRGMPIGVIIPIFCIILTQGIVKVAAITTTTIKAHPHKRSGREYQRLTEFDQARIALAGPLTAIFLALMVKVIFPENPVANMFILINLHLSLFNMIPLPTLDGMKIMFGAPFLYMFSLAFIVATFFLMYLFSTGTSVLLAGIIALIILLLHFHVGFAK